MKIFKFFSVTIVLIVITYFGWMFIDTQHDETLAPGFTDFIAEPVSVPDTQNGFIALIGLGAPADQDTIAFGRKFLDSSLISMNTRNENTEVSQKSIFFNGDSQSLNCWITQTGRADAKNTGQPCASPEQVRKMIADNKLLLDRITMLGNYLYFIEPDVGSYDTGGSPNAKLLIQTQSLLSAQMALDASEGKAEQALATWLAQARIQQNMVNGQLSFASQSIVFVLRSIHNRTLPLIISTMTSQQVTAHTTEIYTALDVPAFGKNGWDVAATLRTEFKAVKTLNSHKKSAFYKPNATGNRFYEWAKEFVELSQAQPKEFLVKYQQFDPARFRKSLWMVFLTSPGNLIGELALDSTFASPVLLLSAQRHTTYRQMLKLYVAAKSQETAADMPKIITGTDPAYHNPLTDEPFGWDATRLSIYFNMPEYPSHREEIFYGNVPPQ